LPKNEAGKAIQYRIKEDQVPGYETSYEGNNVVNKLQQKLRYRVQKFGKITITKMAHVQTKLRFI
ncbi:Cna B-type domain-containing protein, partial [Melissococcus plutonius]|uniref:Cna B-type domain-containing protein n=1 Tax=Melissococcus plutonius TaxID=33970 RepID=UPI003C30AF00